MATPKNSSAEGCVDLGTFTKILYPEAATPQGLTPSIELTEPETNGKETDTIQDVFTFGDP